jgi:hypothetical protein
MSTAAGTILVARLSAAGKSRGGLTQTRSAGCSRRSAVNEIIELLHAQVALAIGRSSWSLHASNWARVGNAYNRWRLAALYRRPEAASCLHRRQ